MTCVKFIILLLSALPLLQAWSDLMTCGFSSTMGKLGSGLGTMGTCASTYSTNQIFINGAAVPGSTGTYVPGSTITVSLSPFSGQLVFQANNGAVFQGSAGSRNKNGIISGCSSVSRYQMYAATAATLKMPAQGAVSIECNFASSKGSKATKVTTPITLTPVGSAISAPSSRPISPPTNAPPSSRPVSPPTNAPTKQAAVLAPSSRPVSTPTNAPVKPSSSPISNPTNAPVQVPVPSFNPTKTSAPNATHRPSSKPVVSPSLKPNLKPSKPPTIIPTLAITEEPTLVVTEEPTSESATSSSSNTPTVKTPTAGTGPGPSPGGLSLGSTTINGNQSVIFLVAFILIVATIIMCVILTLMYRRYKQQQSESDEEGNNNTNPNDENVEEGIVEEDNNNDEDDDDDGDEYVIESTKFIGKKDSHKSNYSGKRSLAIDKAMRRPLSFDDTADKAFSNPMYLNALKKK